jgi:hypothetical protein
MVVHTVERTKDSEEVGDVDRKRSHDPERKIQEKYGL